MAAPRPGRNTIWITDVVWDRVMTATVRQGVTTGRDLEKQVRELVLETLELHLDQVQSVDAGQRPCYVGTLLRYPGRATSSRVWLKDHQKWVNRETLRPGSRRLHMVFPVQTAERAVEYGLVLPHQWIATGVGAGFIDQQRKTNNSRLSASTKGRPLSDSVLTALVTRFGTTTDGPMATIPVQIINQSTAKALWTVASATRTNSPTEQLLTAFLPRLLETPATAERTTDTLANGWDRPLWDLADYVSQSGSEQVPTLPLVW
jgi:hypothetical protein